MMEFFKELLVTLLNFFGWAWWVEITTRSPHCVYYFGPFLSEQEAIAAKVGYLEDLEEEGAQGITDAVKRCKPNQLTIAYDENDLEAVKGKGTPLLDM